MRTIAPLALAALLIGCAPQMYWVKPNANLKQTATDLHACRVETSKDSTQQVYSARELESPCMVAKGYALSEKPPAE